MKDSYRNSQVWTVPAAIYCDGRNLVHGSDIVGYRSHELGVLFDRHLQHRSRVTNIYALRDEAESEAAHSQKVFL